MGKLRIFSGREVYDLLAEHGLLLIRQRGSHILMQKRAEASTITVPVLNHRELKQGTLRSIIRQSGLPRSLFE